MKNYIVHESLDIPKKLFMDKKYSKLDNYSKVLYGMILYQFKFSQERKWIDEEGNYYVKYPISNMANHLNVSNPKIIKCKKELEKYKLIKQIYEGIGKGNRIYINMEV